MVMMLICFNEFQLELDNGEQIKARLVVAADGALSTLRSMSEMPVYGWRYDQVAVTTTVGQWLTAAIKIGLSAYMAK